MNFGFGQAHAKAHLLGEHSVVYGYPAIIAPLLSLSTKAEVIDSDKTLIETDNFSGTMFQLNYRFSGIYSLLTELLNFFEEPDLTFKLHIKSNIPSKKGLGSSAAYAVAIVKAFCDYFDYHYSDEEVFKIAQISENKNHGRSSGGDTYAVMAEGPIFFDTNKDATILKLDTKAYIVVADSGTAGLTSQAVQLVADNYEKDPETFGNYFKQMGAIAEKGREEIIADDLKDFGRLMTENQNLLAKLGVSTPYLERLIKIALNNGALGAKLTGGGLGGSIVALTDTEAKAAEIKIALNKAGAPESWISKI
ncbi:mevalonate kinase [Oenococcus sicerae]|uniref:mevalonate kinase n=1 Tax=Oenococcus sicerae TaxID=2203724 RepID=UPI0010B4E067|nr:Mevalonate kinase {ECO:0000255/HAMAP-Rule:MF_00217} [Oenococcus sicerae]